MKYSKLKDIFLMGCLLCSSQAIAGSDPIAWSLNQPFPTTVQTGINYSVIYTLTNNLPMQLVHPLVIEKNTNSSTEFSYTDNCTGRRLLSNQSCTVQIFLTPFVIGNKSVQISIAGYSKDVVPLPELQTIANSTQASGIVGTVTQTLPNTMNPGASANYVFTFTNYGSVDATGVTTTVTQTTGTVNTTTVCSGTLSKNGGSCTVQGSFTPSSATPSSQTVLASLTFNGASGSPAKASTTTTLNTPNALIVGSIIVPYSLPPLMQGNPSPGVDVKFLFTNVSPGTVTLTDQGIISCTASDNSNCDTSFTTPVSQCVNGSLGPTQACSLTTTFNPPAAGGSPVTYTITGTLGYTGLGNPAAISTSGTVVSTLPSTRTLQMVNNCGFTISYSLNGAALPASAPTSPCPAGSSLAGGSCWWNNYIGSSNILASNTSDFVTIPADSYNGIQWSGNISASTGCDQPGGGNCNQATCQNSGGTTSCAVSKGFTQPATQAEITMLTSGADSYDVEVINGFHIPISMQPYLVIDQVTPSNSVPASADNYSCGTPGVDTAVNGFGACNWQNASVPAPTSLYYLVGGGTGSDCSSTACSGGEICGISQTNGTGPISDHVCGNFQGYWTANQLCTQAGGNLPASLAASLQCNTSTGYNLSPADQFNNTYTSLMACPVAAGYTGPTYNSCYTSTYPSGSAVTQCCGCVDWWDPTQTIGGVGIGANNTAMTCPSGQRNPLWASVVQGGIQWMKRACPSVYVYPFDDATSKFTCTNNTQTGTNTTSYVITFCPGNNGLPAGVNEGRG